jgi:hypothetical protein
MTPQEIFDKAYNGVVGQGCKSKTVAKSCAYNGVYGTHCGVGWVISKEAGKQWDRTNSSSIRVILGRNRSKFIEPWMQENKDLLVDIQTAHDDPEYGDNFIADFKNNMEHVAHSYGLKIPG